jgi:pimeloyl-ACP methyl ester carboxylesterase
LRADTVAVVGHSMGRYTALAMAGHQPSTEHRQPVDVTAEARVKALVLFAPATTGFIARGALRRVGVPIPLRSAGHDSYTPGWQGDVVRHGVPDPGMSWHACWRMQGISLSGRHSPRQCVAPAACPRRIRKASLVRRSTPDRLRRSEAASIHGSPLSSARAGHPGQHAAPAPVGPAKSRSAAGRPRESA